MNEPRRDDLPSFTGDVPIDLVRAARIVRRRFLVTLRSRLVRFGACALIGLAVLATALEVPVRVHPARLGPLPTPVEVAIAAIGVLAGIAAFVRRIPAVLRFVLGLLPGASGVVIAMTIGEPHDGPAFYGGIVALLAFVLVAGFRLRTWAERHLAESGRADG